MLILTLGGTTAPKDASCWAYLTVSNVSCDAFVFLCYNATMGWKSHCDDDYHFIDRI
jgi:hypothetical protein